LKIKKDIRKFRVKMKGFQEISLELHTTSLSQKRNQLKSFNPNFKQIIQMKENQSGNPMKGMKNPREENSGGREGSGIVIEAMVGSKNLGIMRGEMIGGIRSRGIMRGEMRVVHIKNHGILKGEMTEGIRSRGITRGEMRVVHIRSRGITRGERTMAVTGSHGIIRKVMKEEKNAVTKANSGINLEMTKIRVKKVIDMVVEESKTIVIATIGEGTKAIQINSTENLDSLNKTISQKSDNLVIRAKTSISPDKIILLSSHTQKPHLNQILLLQNGAEMQGKTVTNPSRQR
jgi:hypothetical protein